MALRLRSPAIAVIRTIYGAFFAYRQLTPAPRPMADDDLVNDMDQFGYVRLDAAAAPRAVAVYVLGAAGKYAHHGADLKKLLDSVASTTTELIVVAPSDEADDFFKRRTLVEIVRSRSSPACAHYVYPYYIFVVDIPAQPAVPPHRILTSDEVDTLLAREYLHLRDLPVILTTDPPVIWLGGREGQVVEITRPSQTALEAVYYRRIENGV
jgi:DNA-directed RNA polymerase subunit H (RpoH/RPB5)